VKSWQIFVVGIVVTLAVMFLFPYEAALAGVGALIMIAVVVFGFLMRPRHDVFYVRTTTRKVVEGHFCIEHEYIAVRVEVTRLWLLFIPTFSAVAFLSVTFARDSVWNFSLINWLFESGAASTYFFVSRAVLVVIIGLLSTWVNERWVLRDADARSAQSISIGGARVSYAFVDQHGAYYGGEGFAFGIRQPPELATLIVYRPTNPELNKIGMALLFHRLVIIGRGLTDLGENTIAAGAHAVHAAQ
jgi:hypothetical protein